MCQLALYCPDGGGKEVARLRPKTMGFSRVSYLIGLAVAVAQIGAPPSADAALGGALITVEGDRVHMQAALTRVTRTDGYTIHELRVPTGTLVREYVSSSDNVFAVTWQGPWLPDFRQLLGTYFEQYRTAAQNARRSREGRGPLLIQEGGLVVQSGGHPRSFTGRAYLSTLLPPGLVPSAIQ